MNIVHTLVCRNGSHTKTPKIIAAEEASKVVSLVGEVAFYLYHHYRTAMFKAGHEMEDGFVGEQIGWPARKVQKYRLELEKAGLVSTVKHGSSSRGLIELCVGTSELHK